MEGTREITEVGRGISWDFDTRILYVLNPLLNLGRTDGGREIKSRIISRRQQRS